MKTKRLLLFTVALGVMVMGCESTDPGFTEGPQNQIQVNEMKASPSVSAALAPAGYQLIWEDQFDGTAINTNNWTVGSLRDQATGDLVPGAHGDHLLNTGYAGYITAEDCYLENGALVLRNQKRSYAGTSPGGTYQYTSGWVMSMHKVFFNKGYVEMRAQFPTGEKVWPALWLIAEDLVWGPEWDMFEYFGYRSDVGYDVMGMHLARGEWPSITWHSSWIRDYNLNYGNETWHTYGFEWKENEANWYIDGQLVHTLVKRAPMSSTWPNENMYIVLNNGLKTDSPEGSTVFPNYVVIDYIQVYQESGGSGGNDPVSAHVQAVTTGTQSVGQGNKKGTATITIHDNLEGSVAGATVTGTFAGAFNETVSGQTGPDGKVTLVTTGTAQGGVTVNFCVDNITHSSLSYNANQNDTTCN